MFESPRNSLAKLRVEVPAPLHRFPFSVLIDAFDEVEVDEIRSSCMMASAG